MKKILEKYIIFFVQTISTSIGFKIANILNITSPPPIKNGVKVINTNIEYLLDKPVEACQHIEAISRFYGIDGWLVQIENDITGGMARLEKFVKWLKKTQGSDNIGM